VDVMGVSKVLLCIITEYVWTTGEQPAHAYTHIVVGCCEQR